MNDTDKILLAFLCAACLGALIAALVSKQL